jgi:ABC-type dipeptide/oligopeptide/nickel transport system ATPase component
MSKGSIVAQGPPAEVFSQEIGGLIGMPEMVRLSGRLREKGITMKRPWLTVDDAAEELSLKPMTSAISTWASTPQLSPPQIGKAGLPRLQEDGSGKSTCCGVLGLANIRGPCYYRWTGFGNPGQYRVSIQFPERALFERTVYDEVAFGPRNMGIPDDEVRQLTERAIDSVGISSNLFTVLPRSLSYGRKRLVAIACAIAHGPGYLFLDEPAAGLDYQGRMRIASLQPQ